MLSGRLTRGSIKTAMVFDVNSLIYLILAFILLDHVKHQTDVEIPYVYTTVVEFYQRHINPI